MVVTCQAEDGARTAYRVPRACGRTSCPAIELAVPRAVIRSLFEGTPLERIDAIGELTDMRRHMLFPPKCSCGSNHAKYAQNLLRCYEGLSERARAVGAELELSVGQWIRLAAVQGISPEETARLQIAEIAVFAFGGTRPEPPPAESVDTAEAGENAA